MTHTFSNAVDGHDGITLRDFLAAKAMAAVISHHGVYDEGQRLGTMSTATLHDYHADVVAETAYAYADAMLAARSRANR